MLNVARETRRIRNPGPLRRQAGVPALFCRAFLLAALLMCAGDGEAAERTAVHLTIDGPIGPATTDYITRGLETAAEREAEIVVISMDTPGGLSASMRDIIKAILASPVPVASYVAPSGARAASAGTYILYASHVAAMAPGTNLGAATPVQLGGPPGGGGTGGEAEEDAEENGGKAGKPGLEDKAVADAEAYIRSLAKLRGRNEEWAAKAVTEAASLPAEDALKMNVIDVIAGSIGQLLEKIHGRTVTVNDSERALDTRNLTLVAEAPDWRTKLLAIITNPNIAYLLLMIGVYGLILEFANPGAIVPGVIGAVCLLLGMFALQLLPINYAGLALIALGLALMVAEAFAPSFGILGLGGIVAFVIGSILLIDTEVPAFQLSLYLILPVAAITAGVFVLVLTLAMRAWRRPVATGAEAMLSEPGTIVEWHGDQGRVRVHGEIWMAEGPPDLTVNDSVVIKGRDKLTLSVDRVDRSNLRPDEEGEEPRELPEGGQSENR